MKIIPFFILIIISFNGIAQQVDWLGQFTSDFEINMQDIATDWDGNIYLTGRFYTSDSADFDPGPGIFNLYGGSAAIVCKLDAQGNLIWAKALNGSSNIIGYGIAVDASGGVYITGTFSFTADFDPGPGVYNLSGTAGGDIFICKLNSSGDFQWAMNIGETSPQAGRDIQVDANNNFFVTGYSKYGDFDPGLGSFILTSSDYSAFVAKYDENGNFITAVHFQGTDDCRGNALAVEPSGNIYLTGFFEGNCDFDPGAGVSNLTASTTCAYVCKLDTGLNFIWAKIIGGSSTTGGLSIAVNNSGQSIIGGYFWGDVDLDPGASIYNINTSGFQDLFILKLDDMGNFVWGGSYGSSASDGDIRVTMDQLSNVYIQGTYINSIDLDFGAGTSMVTTNGGMDIFMVQLNSDGLFQWGGTMGGPDNDSRGSLVVSDAYKLYHVGNFKDTADLNPSVPIEELYSLGDVDGYIQIMSGFNTADVSLQHNYLLPEISISPNPTDGTFIIDFNYSTQGIIEIMDINGRVVHNCDIQGDKKKEVTILESAGVYFVKIQTNRGQFFSRILKK